MAQTMPPPTDRGEQARTTCRYGYTRDDLVTLFGDRLREFTAWMRGQTAMICDGQEFDHDTREYRATGCGPHGTVVYRWDVERFQRGGPVID